MAKVRRRLDRRRKIPGFNPWRVLEVKDENGLLLPIMLSVELELRLDDADPVAELVDVDSRLFPQLASGRLSDILTRLDTASRKLPPHIVGPARVPGAEQEQAPFRIQHRDAHGLATDHGRTTPSGNGESFSAPSTVIRKLSSTRRPPPPSQ